MPAPAEPKYGWQERPSADVEIAAYVVLALLQQRDVPTALPIVRFLVGSRSALGGWYSTQGQQRPPPSAPAHVWQPDTVMGLEALATFASAVFSDTTSNVELSVWDATKALVRQGASLFPPLARSLMGQKGWHAPRRWRVS